MTLAPLLALAVAFVPQATKVDKLPRPFTDEAVDKWIGEEHLDLDPRYRRRFFEAHAGDVAEGKLVDVVQSIVEGLRGPPWALHPEAKGEVLAKLEAFLPALRTASRRAST